MTKTKNKVKYKTGDIVILKRSSFTDENAKQMARMLKKPVIITEDVNDLSSISKKDLERVIKRMKHYD